MNKPFFYSLDDGKLGKTQSNHRTLRNAIRWGLWWARRGKWVSSKSVKFTVTDAKGEVLYTRDYQVLGNCSYLRPYESEGCIDV